MKRAQAQLEQKNKILLEQNRRLEEQLAYIRDPFAAEATDRGSVE